jgi:hypothetical protein
MLLHLNCTSLGWWCRGPETASCLYRYYHLALNLFLILVITAPLPPFADIRGPMVPFHQLLGDFVLNLLGPRLVSILVHKVIQFIESIYTMKEGWLVVVVSLACQIIFPLDGLRAKDALVRGNGLVLAKAVS